VLPGMIRPAYTIQYNLTITVIVLDIFFALNVHLWF